MREPPPVEWGEWVTVIFASVLASILAGLGSAMAWFRSEKRALRKDMAGIGMRMDTYDKSHADHSTEIAVMKTCQENTADRLETIMKTLDRLHDKLDSMQGRH